MNCEKIIVKNEPACVDNNPIRFVKRPISRQQHSKADKSKTSSRRSKSHRQEIRGYIKSEPIEVQVKKEPSTDGDNESSSHKCKICKKMFANLRSLNKHARIHSDEEAKKSDVEPKKEEVKSEPIDLEKYRIKQELIRELEDKEHEALERRNMTKVSIAFLLDTDEPAERVAHVETQEPAVEPDEQQQADTHTTNNRFFE
jgi:hypothetical protein